MICTRDPRGMKTIIHQHMEDIHPTETPIHLTGAGNIHRLAGIRIHGTENTFQVRETGTTMKGESQGGAGVHQNEITLHLTGIGIHQTGTDMYRKGTGIHPTGIGIHLKEMIILQNPTGIDQKGTDARWEITIRQHGNITLQKEQTIPERGVHTHWTRIITGTPIHLVREPTHQLWLPLSQ